MLFKFFVVTIFLAYLTLIILIIARTFYRTRRPGLDPVTDFQREEASSEVLIELIDVWKSFDQPVLKGVSLQIRRGETLGVLGKSGTGKSVLLKLIAGFLRPDQGRVLFMGEDLSDMSESELLKVRRKVSYVFQGGAVFDFLDVRENISFPLQELGVTDPVKIRQRVDYLLHAVELEKMGEMRSAELSAGAKKQVAIARAIAINPEAILYDEPTTGVDPIIGKALSRLIRKLNKLENLTSVVVTHDLKCIEIVADRIILLKDGHIHFAGDQEEFHNSPDSFIQAFIAGRHYEEEAAEEEVLA
jgi:phospholipid/cholesterol/gamma-HCH transport system ATP-binding protein